MSDTLKNQPSDEQQQKKTAEAQPFRRTCSTCRTFQSCWSQKCCRKVRADHGFNV